MEFCVLFLRILLAVVFLAAAIGKLLDRNGTQEAARDFGVPPAVVGITAWVLPLVETVIAVLLVPASTAVLGAAAAIVLLGAFTVAIAISLRRGRRPDCHCFGRFHSAPIGTGVLVRNAVLISAAVVVLGTGGGLSLSTWWSDLDGTARGLVLVCSGVGAVFVLQLAVLWRLFVSYGTLLVRVDQLEAAVESLGALEGAEGGGRATYVGTPAPPFELAGLYGELMTLPALLAKKRPALFIFTDPNCGPCAALTPEIAVWQRAYEATIAVTIVSRGTVDENLVKFVAAGVTGVLVQSDNEVAERYRVPGTPSAVLIDAEGVIASELAVGGDEIRRLVHAAAGAPQAPVAFGRENGNGANGNGANGNGANGNGAHGGVGTPRPRHLGDSAPDIDLPDLEGQVVSLRELRGRELLIVFWNPECGFCQQLLPVLLEWERQRNSEAPEPLIVTTGSLDENRLLGFRSTVLFDESFTVGPQFGAGGTPIAVVLDRDGNIASELAVGGPAIMELARSARPEHS
jgi:thiol-disulfide isomerase/thioredoxin/uncharacterized membrane protein YphA (DoxX/SURF4 family)